MILSVIVAVSTNLVIGANNKLLWHISDDLKRFKSLTTGHTVIMGRKTFQSIGRALPNRTNIVISRNPDFTAEGCTVLQSLEQALRVCCNQDEVFIMGGGQIYRQALPLAQKIYLTKVHKEFEGDTFFPEISPEQWRIVAQQPAIATDGLKYTFIDFERI